MHNGVVVGGLLQGQLVSIWTFPVSCQWNTKHPSTADSSPTFKLHTYLFNLFLYFISYIYNYVFVPYPLFGQNVEKEEFSAWKQKNVVVQEVFRVCLVAK